jgi:CBS domain-containing protein
MKTRDFMTSPVVSVTPDMPVNQVARVLLEHGISAAPVVDERGEPIGMISEGDLIARDDRAREARRDWWLTLLAEGEALHPDFLAGVKAPQTRVRDVMTSPVITVGEETELRDVARLLTAHRIKRVPVLSDGRVVGILSRADCVRALGAAEQTQEHAPPKHGRLEQVWAELDARVQHHKRTSELDHQTTTLGKVADQPELQAADFRGLVAAHRSEEWHHLEDARRAEEEQKRRRVSELIDLHVSDEGWRGLLHRAREAAEHGNKEFLLLQAPSQLCSDSGRAINAGEQDWPATLRGEAAELYLRWERELRPNGFHLAARVIDFPDGKPGDIGLFLVWGE